MDGMSGARSLLQEVSTQSNGKWNRTNVIVAIDRGSGDPALVFLHHFGGSSREWTEAIAELSAEHRCIAVDTNGFGLAAEESGYAVDEMVKGLERILADRQIASYVVVGHSMTGKVAMGFAALEPDGLEALVLVAPSPPGPEPITDEARDEMRARDGSHSNAWEMIRKIVGRPLSPDVRERAIEDHMRSSPAAWSAWLESGSYEDWSERVGVLSTPTLLMTGEKDPALPKSIQQRLTLPHLSKAEMVELAGSGHLLPLEAPEELARLMRGFLKKYALIDGPWQERL